MAKPSKQEMLRLLTAHLQGFVDKGRWIMFRCPYHDDRNPSFGIDTKNGGFNCFACGQTGTFPQLLSYLGIESDLEEVDAMSESEWGDVLESLEEEVREIKWPGEDLKIRSPFLEKAPNKYKKYLEGRGLDISTILRFGIGWSPKESNRVLIPVKSLRGDQVIWIERRRIDGSRPKYWRPKGSSKELALYGYSDISGYNWVVVTEGIFDVIALASKNIPAVCCFGGFSTFQRNALVKRFDVIYICFDGDSAGRKKAVEAKRMLAHCGCYVRKIKLPEGKDPGNYSEHIAEELLSVQE